ncbi:hypothetical protein OS175_00700 [Marinicella sp. S1101]|uniref:hypothetical protein n=1 Tax=Marinicella marina TaxID=2996016 RepID=UPI002260C9A7|nr:hypothetical protein [Marinicella marina]MCX7552381.1 hypothetical protein [Marinicella marina]MDJ1139256.1 hypothetical protein [Marinicella marina]
MAELIKTHPSQKREVLNCNSQLSKIAQKRAEALSKNTADPEITANQIVAKGGFRFPDYYPISGNQVEAVAKSAANSDSVLNHLVNSDKHHNHILGKGEFFVIQTELGVGYYQDDDPTNETQWVVLISQAWESPKYKYTQKFAKPAIRGPDECYDKKQLRMSPELKEKCRSIANRSKKKD